MSEQDKPKQVLTSYAEGLNRFNTATPQKVKRENLVPSYNQQQEHIAAKPVVDKRSSTFLKIDKKDIPPRPTINLDLAPIVEGISISFDGIDTPISVRLSEEFPKLLIKINDLKLFSNKPLKSSEVARLLMAIGVTFINRHLKE